MTGRRAGGSAADIARRHREKIARLERSAAGWEAGAAGERAVGEVLDGLAASGWTVMHDVAWPGRAKANLDHVVVGPAGAFVIDAKNWSGAVEVRDGVLRQNGRTREKEVAAVAEAANAVVRLVPDVAVQPVLCLVGEEPRRGWVRDVMLCSTATLREMLESRPVVLSPADVARVGGLLGVGLARRPVSSSSRPRERRSSGPGRRARTRGSSLPRLLGSLVIVALMFGALQTGLFTPLLRSVSDYVAEVVVGEPVAPPTKPEQRLDRRRQRDDRPQR